MLACETALPSTVAATWSVGRRHQAASKVSVGGGTGS